MRLVASNLYTAHTSTDVARTVRVLFRQLVKTMCHVARVEKNLLFLPLPHDSTLLTAHANDLYELCLRLTARLGPCHIHLNYHFALVADAHKQCIGPNEHDPSFKYNGIGLSPPPPPLPVVFCILPAYYECPYRHSSVHSCQVLLISAIFLYSSDMMIFSLFHLVESKFGMVFCSFATKFIRF